MRFIQLVTLIFGTALILTIFSSPALAQTSGGAIPTGQALSFHMGPLLPESIPATDEILSGVGFRYAYPYSSKSLIEAGYTGSNSEGVKYSNIDVSLRGDMPFQDIFVFGLIGLDSARIKGATSEDFTYYVGGHVGGGLLAHIADTLFLRMEMRFNFHPGTILFFGFGFEYRFGSGGSGN